MQAHISTKHNRVIWIDTAKAIGVVLVVLGHFLYNAPAQGGLLIRAIYSFHMPMFFIAAGYVSCGKKKDNSWIKKRFLRVFLPILLWEVLIEPLSVLAFDYEFTWEKAIYLYGKVIFNEPVWFFICLFCVEVLIYATDYTKINKKACV